MLGRRGGNNVSEPEAGEEGGELEEVVLIRVWVGVL